MTRTEFLESVNSWWELIDFCSEYDCEYLNNVYDEDSMDEEVNWAVREYGGDYSWQELRNRLDEIPTGYEYYYQNGSFDWDGLDDSDFDSYKDDVLDWADGNGLWDDEEEEDEEYLDEEPIEEEEDEPFAEEDFSVDDLMGMCSVTLVTIQTDSLRRIQEADAAFEQFIDVNVPRVLK